jgi:hypothetical protein
VNKDSAPIIIFLLFLMEVIQLLVAETNKYIDTFDNDSGHSQLPDVTVQETYSFLAIIIQMGHDVTDTMKAYWLTLEQFYIPF